MIPTLGILMSLNDPQWGNRGGDDNKPGAGGPRRPNDGPPDLDEIWREFNRRLKKRFDAEAIELPFPQTTIWFGQDKVGNAPPARVVQGSSNA